MNQIVTCSILCLTLSAAPGFAGEVTLATGANVQLVPISDVEATLSRDGNAAEVRFNKTGDVRRMLALAAKPAGALPEPRALEIAYAMQLDGGPAPRPAVVVYERGGGAWFKVRNRPVSVSEAQEVCKERVPMANLREAAFSRDANGQLDWDQVEKVWVGLIMDEPTRGQFQFLSAKLTDEPYKPTHPLPVPIDRTSYWTVGKDAAATAKLTAPKEGPDGQACMKLEFTFPGGRHMWVVPSARVPDAELEGFRALKLRYKADLPEGIKGLLVTVIEGSGGQYYADPPPPASADWTTIELAFADLKKASWSRDPNNKLDLADITKVNVGTHGTAKPAQAKGCIWVAEVQFLP